MFQPLLMTLHMILLSFYTIEIVFLVILRFKSKREENIDKNNDYN